MKNVLLTSLFFFALTVCVSAQERRDLEPDFKAKVTKVIYYHDNGAVSQTGFFDAEGRLHGAWKSYTPQGESVAVGSYEHGKKTGKWLFWNTDKLTEVDFKANTILTSTEWHTACAVVDRN